MVKVKQFEQLPGLETPIVEVVPQTPNLSSKNAFGRVPKPEYFGIDIAQFESVTPQEYAAISPERAIVPRLYGGKTGRSVDTLALNAAEYEAIVRSPGGFAVSVAAKTDHARQIDHVLGRREQVVSRSVEHALKSKTERADTVIAGLESEHSSLKKLLKEIHSPGYAHVTEAQMRILAETARLSFDNLLAVAGHQAGWTPEQKERAALAMNARLFDPNYRAAFSYWEAMTGVALDYTARKTSLFKRRRRQISSV